MIIPTIGRVVWFHPAHVSRRDDRDQPLAALIVRVHADDRINLVVFDQNGVPSGDRDVLLWNGEGDRPEGDFAEWMPYQKGQAAKAEALEAKLSQPADPSAAASAPAKAAGESAKTYRDRVGAWREEEQARIAADNAADDAGGDNSSIVDHNMAKASRL